MNRRMIEAAWDSYRRMVLPTDASDVQIKETRQAFFAGAATLFHAVLRAVSPGDEVTPADIDFMQALQTEIDQFGAEIDARVLGALRH